MGNTSKNEDSKNPSENQQKNMDRLQGESELEKLKKEMISALYNDWIYEYNIKEKKLTTISGNYSMYHIVRETETGQQEIWLDNVHPDDRQAFDECYQGTSADNIPGYVETRVMAEGEYRWISLTARVLRNRAGEGVSVIGKISDIHAKKKEELRLQMRSVQDSMTGLLNRLAFYNEAEKWLEAATQNLRKTPALLMVDIDKFKEINDRQGHLYGDMVMVSMAEALRKVFGEKAVIGRFGGDEFTVLFLHTDKDELEDVISYLREEYAREVAEVEADSKVTCSVGAARYGVDGTTIEELLKNADSALYYVKKNGRDGYAICTETIKKKFAKSFVQVSSEELKNENRQVAVEITQFALELLEGSKDLKSAMNVLLMRIGKKFDLSAVSIREYSKKKIPVLSYLWSNMEKPDTERAASYVSSEERRRIREDFFKNQTLEIVDIEKLPERDGLYRLYSEVNVRALYQCPFVSEGQVFGYIAYADTKPREWTESEKQSLLLIARIISNYLGRELAYERIAHKIELMKSKDEVTGLLKYDKFKEVAQSILNQSNPGMQYAIVSTDFANFKYFNEVYGFRKGDEMLCEFANLIAKYNPRAIAACRDYADNFWVMVMIKSQEALMDDITNYNKTFMANQNEHYMDSKLELRSGAYIITGPEEDIVQALDNANTARKILKEKGKTGVLLFEPSMRVNRMRELAILHMLEEAISNNEFKLYLQPKWSMETGKIVGAEGLARWEKSNGEVVSPAEFIPPLEKSGKIVQLDFYMYEKALKQQREWLNAGYPVVPVSINLSRHHIHDEQLVEKLTGLLETYEIDSKLIEIEITESAFIEDQTALVSLMKAIKEKGFLLSIDDFGTGYSSLSMLTELPADIVKLDKEFLKNSDSESAKGMLNNVIRLIKDNHMKVVCEGVEIEEQASFLAKAGCDLGQGYYFSKPIPVAEFETLYFK